MSGPLSLPPITMAFCIVDNGKAYLGKSRGRDSRRVHQIIVACVRAALRCVDGGYFCRQQVRAAGGGGSSVLSLPAAVLVATRPQPYGSHAGWLLPRAACAA